MKRFLFAVAVLIATGVQAQEIKIGLAGPITGPLAFLGQHMKWGAELAIEEHDVDGKTHEPRVHGRSGPQQQAFPGWELLPAQQSAQARVRAIRDRALLAHDAANAVIENQLLHFRQDPSIGE